jgi:hypothetical protein
MSKKFESVFELYYYQPRRQVTGNKFQMVFKKTYSEAEQHKLDGFFDEDVSIRVIEHVPGGASMTTDVVIEGIFHVMNISPQRLASGNKCNFVLENMLDRSNLEKAASLFEKDTSIFMEIIQQELPGMAEDEEEVVENEENILPLGIE